MVNLLGRIVVDVGTTIMYLSYCSPLLTALFLRYCKYVDSGNKRKGMFMLLLDISLIVGIVSYVTIMDILYPFYWVEWFRSFTTLTNTYPPVSAFLQLIYIVAWLAVSGILTVIAIHLLPENEDPMKFTLFSIYEITMGCLIFGALLICA